jgi:phospholipid/cholesterol/gamma-HCH transport system ATP-binding protein
MSETAAIDALHDVPEAAGPVVAFQHVSIAFEENVVLEDISFTVRPGETRVLLGPAGVGKSVLLKIALGLLKPDLGAVKLFGQSIARMPEEKLFALRARSGMVFQEGALFDSLSVRDNVAYQLIQEHVPDAEIDARVRESLRFVGLEQTFAEFPASLSGGMRRRVAIARALIAQPELILYDSPTGGLDPVTSTQIIELLVKQRDVHRTPSIMVTHRLQDAFALSTHRWDAEREQMTPLEKDEIDPNTTYMMLEDGRLIFDGSLHNLLHSTDPFVREFLL